MSEERQPSASGERSIAAGESIGVAVSGDGARVVVLPAEAVHWARTVEAPAGAGFLPGSASGVFVGREGELAELRSLLTGEGTAAVTQQVAVRAIHGLGGVGKSTLALQYAHRYRESYSLVWWLGAETAESIVTGLAGLAMALCPQWAGAVGPDERAAWAMLWLQEHEGWLLVFDNVEDPAVLKPYVGTLHRGHHLATSRRATGWHAVARPMALGLLPLEEAVDLLTRIAFPERAPSGAERGSAAELARVLGCLPLALEQAGAYVHETGAGLEAYRRSLELVLDDASEGIDPERTIARIWGQTISAISRRDPLAVALLNAMAWLAPDDIPRGLLMPLAPDEVALNRALGVLHSYNMVSFTEPGNISVHRLVQTVLRNKDPRAGRRDAERALQQATPSHDEDDVSAADRWQQLLPHIDALAESTPPQGVPTEDLALAYLAAAQHLFRQGRDSQTITLRQLVLAHAEQTAGDSHTFTWAARNNLAGAYTAAGNVEQSIPLLEAALTQHERDLGRTHPDTLAVRHNLADAYASAEDLQRAIPLMKTSLAQHEQVLGPTHSETLRARYLLAHAYLQARDLEQAIPLMETTLTQYEQAFGDTHIDTLTARNGLAMTYLQAGDLARAVLLLETTLSQRKQVLGDTHPHTMNTRATLALLQPRSAGRIGPLQPPNSLE